MPEGKVKWFNTRKGYGFISASDGPDIFVHYSNITGDGYRTLNEGDSVSFDIVEGEKGLRAENVTAQQAAQAKPEKKTNAAMQKEAEA
jgi:CspA family cold shock protein